MGILSTINVLNDDEAPKAIESNALNVTRIGGIASTITAVGAAATGIFTISETDKVAQKVAITAATGAIVAVALVAVAIIIAADLRARTEAECCKGGATTDTSAAAATTDAAKAKAKAEYKAAITEAVSDVDRQVGNISENANRESLRSIAFLYTGLARTIEKLSPPERWSVVHNSVVAQAESLAKDATTLADTADADQRASLIEVFRVRVDQLRTRVLTAAEELAP
jgi:hypothetical protein